MTSKKKFVVAVDGPAGSGKSSVSKEAAIALNLKYIDSGALYRSVTWYFLESHERLTPDIDFGAGLGNIELRQVFKPDGSAESFVNDRDVTHLIRNEKITGNIGVVSDDKCVRDFVNRTLREWARDSAIIMDGRDIGTHVLKDAKYKFFLPATVEKSAERRYREQLAKGMEADLEEIKRDIRFRDNNDSTRAMSPLKQAEDAILIDTTNQTIDEMVEDMARYIHVS